MAKTTFIKGFKPMDGRQYEDGRTINEIVLDYNPDTGVWDTPVVCLLNNEPILRKDWGLATTSQDVISFIEYPMGGGGGGSNPLQILFTVVVGVVAIMTGQWWAGTFLGLTTGTFMFYTMAALAGAAIMMVGSLVAGMIFKGPSVPSGHLNAATNEAASPTYSINASNNQARLYQPIGEGFGRIKIIPDRAAHAWTNYSQNDMYIYQVFAIGRGSYQIETMSFGDTVFWDNGSITDTYDVQVQFREAGQAVTLFPDNVETSIEVAGQNLFQPNDPQYEGAIGPFSANPPGTVTDRIICNLTFPQGIGRFNDKGKITEITIKYVIQIRRIDDDGNPISSWGSLYNGSKTADTLTPQRITIDRNVTTGRYEVRMNRSDEQENDGRTLAAMQWESMSAFLPGSLTYNQATVALKVKASNTLTQQASSNFSIVYTRKLPIYNPNNKTWSAPQATRKFAAAISSILRSEWGGALPDRRIDLDSLWKTIDPILTAKNWTFDGYFDGAYSIWTLLFEMCQPFRVVPRIVNGGVSFVYDQPGRPVRHIFTPHDIMRGSVSITYNTFTEDTPDNMIWNYLDEAAGFQQREVRASLPNSETKNPVIKSFIGVVKRAQAFQMGVFAIACNRHRRVQIKFSCESLGRLIHMGDVCSFTHPYYSNMFSGLVKSFDESILTIDSGDVINLSEEQQNKTLYLAFNKPDGKPWGPCMVQAINGSIIRLNQADYTLMLSQGQGNPFSWLKGEINGNQTIFSLQSSRNFAGRIIIQNVVANDMYHYEITAINDSDDIDNYNNLAVPPWQYRPPSSGGGGTVLTAPTGFSASATGTVNSPTITLTWLPVVGANRYQVEMATGANPFALQANVMMNQLTRAVPKGTIAFRIRAIDVIGTLGPSGEWSGNTDNMFSSVISFELDGDYEGGEFTIIWGAPSDATPLDYNLKIYRPGSSSPIKEFDFDPSITQFHFTREMSVSSGGLWRQLTATLTGNVIKGGYQTTATAFTMQIIDYLPEITGEAEIVIGPDSITLNSIQVDGPYDGFLIVMGSGPGFQIDGAIDIRHAASLPYTWTGLEPEKIYYFRLAAKDKMANLTNNFQDLLFSEVLSVITIAGEENE
jgi:hypothetical protein